MIINRQLVVVSGKPLKNNSTQLHLHLAGHNLLLSKMRIPEKLRKQQQKVMSPSISRSQMKSFSFQKYSLTVLILLNCMFYFFQSTFQLCDLPLLMTQQERKTDKEQTDFAEHTKKHNGTQCNCGHYITLHYSRFPAQILLMPEGKQF